MSRKPNRENQEQSAQNPEEAVLGLEVADSTDSIEEQELIDRVRENKLYQEALDRARQIKINLRLKREAEANAEPEKQSHTETYRPKRFDTLSGYRNFKGEESRAANGSGGITVRNIVRKASGIKDLEQVDALAEYVQETFLAPEWKEVDIKDEDEKTVESLKRAYEKKGWHAHVGYDKTKLSLYRSVDKKVTLDEEKILAKLLEKHGECVLGKIETLRAAGVLSRGDFLRNAEGLDALLSNEEIFSAIETVSSAGFIIPRLSLSKYSIDSEKPESFVAQLQKDGILNEIATRAKDTSTFFRVSGSDRRLDTHKIKEVFALSEHEDLARIIADFKTGRASSGLGSHLLKFKEGGLLPVLYTLRDQYGLETAFSVLESASYSESLGNPKIIELLSDPEVVKNIAAYDYLFSKAEVSTRDEPHSFIQSVLSKIGEVNSPEVFKRILVENQAEEKLAREIKAEHPKLRVSGSDRYGYPTFRGGGHLEDDVTYAAFLSPNFGTFFKDLYSDDLQAKEAGRFGDTNFNLDYSLARVKGIFTEDKIARYFKPEDIHEVLANALPVVRNFAKTGLNSYDILKDPSGLFSAVSQIEEMKQRLGDQFDMFMDTVSGSLSQQDKVDLNSLYSYLHDMEKMYKNGAFEFAPIVRECFPNTFMLGSLRIISEGIEKDGVEHWKDSMQFMVDKKDSVAKTFGEGALTIDAYAYVYRLMKENPSYAEVFTFFAESDNPKSFNSIHDFRNVADAVIGYDKKDWPMCMEIMDRVDNSPSSEVRKIAQTLILNLLKAEDPISKLAQIEEIFIENNLPLAGKIFEVFKIMHSPEDMDATLERLEYLSPALRQATKRRRFDIVKNDLVAIHVDSANPSLAEYVGLCTELDSLCKEMEQIEASGQKIEIPEDQKHMIYRALDILHTMLPGRMIDERADVEMMDTREVLLLVKSAVGASGAVTVEQAILRRFFNGYDFDSLAGIQDRMEQKVQEADRRGRAYASENNFTLQEGDLIKGLGGIKYATMQLDAGIVSAEYLGVDSSGNRTPFDADFWRVQEREGTFNEVLQANTGSDYRDFMCVVRGKGQLHDTTAGEEDRLSEIEASTQKGKGYELFKTGVLGDRHYGVRTGIASSEVDFMIDFGRHNGERQKEVLRSFAIDCAKKGWYIPVVNEQGKLILTPSEYDAMKKLVDESDPENKDAVPVIEDVTLPIDLAEKIDAVAATKEREGAFNRTVIDTVNTSVERVLSSFGIPLRSKRNTSLKSAVITNTGSTSRGTNKQNDFDFDFNVALNLKDFKSAKEIKRQIIESMDGEIADGGFEHDSYLQIRLKNVTRIGDLQLDNPADIDIGLSTFGEVVSENATSDVLARRLQKIEDAFGEDQKHRVLAEITVAKDMLAEAGVYKKTEGGMGGVGVENWILNNDASLAKAFISFDDKAYKNGQLVPFEEFGQVYAIMDIGNNIKGQGHENFIAKLNQQSYEKMAAMVHARAEEIRNA